MEGESGATPSIIAELDFWNIQGYQMAGEGGVNRLVIDELHCSDLIKWKVKLVLLELSLMILILRMTKEIK